MSTAIVPRPCPFCGSCSIGAYDGSTFRWLAARCNECGATAGEVRINTLIPRDEAWPQANEDALQEWNRRAQLHPEARWYAVSRDGRATLCVSEQDARECAASQDVDWPNRAPHRAVQLIPAQPQPEARVYPLPERWVVVCETVLDVGLGGDVRTGGRPELGYALIANAGTFSTEDEAHAAHRSASLPLGWVVMPLSRLLSDLYEQPEARELTDDELRNLWINRPSIHNGELVPQLYDFARAVLAAAKGKP